MDRDAFERGAVRRPDHHHGRRRVAAEQRVAVGRDGSRVVQPRVRADQADEAPLHLDSVRGLEVAVELGEDGRLAARVPDPRD